MTAIEKRRIDQLLVERGLAGSRQKAQALILAGQVLVDGHKAGKAGHAVATDSQIEVTGQLPYVSRAGGKLAAALDGFGIDPIGRISLDIGTSTGGFTDCLLQRGAARVHAVDTGTGQIAWKLRTDPRVVLHENCNARYLAPGVIGETVSLVVIDVSFISVTLIVPILPPLLANGAELVILVKPQFEVGRGQVGKGGIVRDPALHQAACKRVETAVTEIGYRGSIMDSPILGAEGNREFLLYGRR